MWGLLTYIDYLGKDARIYIYGSDRYKTKLGGVFSILASIAIFSLSLYFAISVLTRQQMNLVSSKTDSFTKSLSLDTTPILFSSKNVKGESIPLNVSYLIIQMWNYYAESHGALSVTSYNVKQCDSSDIQGYESLFQNFKLSDYMCINRTNVNITVFGSNGDVTDGYSKLQIYPAMCVNGSALNPNNDKNNCLSNNDITSALQTYKLYMIYPDILINFDNTTDPFIPYVRTDEFTFPLEANYKYMYNFKKAILNTDLGFVFEDNKKDEIFQYDKVSNIAFFSTKFNIEGSYGLVSITLSEKADTHSRSYVKLQALVANIGGVVNFIMILAKFIVEFVTKKLLLLSYVNGKEKVKFQPNPIETEKFAEVTKKFSNTTVVNFVASQVT
jgi:hypothetical protein